MGPLKCPGKRGSCQPIAVFGARPQEVADLLDQERITA